MSQTSTALSRDERKALARASQATTRGPPPEQTGRRLLSFPELKTRKGVSFTRQYVARLVNEGKFPRPVRATDDGWHIAWLEHEIDAWIDARAAARDSEENT